MSLDEGMPSLLYLPITNTFSLPYVYKGEKFLYHLYNLTSFINFGIK